MLNVKLMCVANIFTRLMHFEKAGDIEQGHTHPFDHVTLLSAGSIRLTVNGQSKDYKAPQMIFIKAEEVHELVALEDDTVAACIHGLRTGEAVEDLIDPDSIPPGINPAKIALNIVHAITPHWEQTVSNSK